LQPNLSVAVQAEAMLPFAIADAATRSRRPAYFVEKLADTISGDIFGGRLTTTRCAIVDPGPF
jgi:hypothetical protein